MDSILIRIIEFSVALLLFFAPALSLASKGFAKSYISVMLVVLCCVLSFRGAEYNSDTFHYFNWFDYARGMTLIESFVIKLEPVHFLLINVSPNFTVWILLENFLILSMVIYLLRRQSIGYVMVMIGFTLPLLSSSFRYVLGLLLVIFIYERFKGWKFINIISVFSGLAHTSMFVGTYIIRIPFWMKFLIPIGVYALFYFVINYMDRFEVNASDSDGVIVGVRGALVFVALYLYYGVRFRGAKNSIAFGLDYLVLIVAFFISANLFFPMANRWINLACLLFMSDLDLMCIRYGADSKGVLFFSILYLFMIAPFLIYNFNIIYFLAEAG
jgi:hypothetical protein